MASGHPYPKLYFAHPLPLSPTLRVAATRPAAGFCWAACTRGAHGSWRGGEMNRAANQMARRNESAAARRTFASEA